MHELLDDARKAIEAGTKGAKELCERALQDLEAVEEYVRERYNELPAGHDEREERVMDKLREVMDSLEGEISSWRELQRQKG